MVSVLMLTYNQEKYIAQAIRSVIRQVCDFQIELVIGDDKSTDNTAAICREFQQKYPSIIKLTVNERNLGLQQNFIDTYNRCTGKYIAVCEGDDYWISKYKLQRQVDILEKNAGYAMCFHRVLNYFEKDNSKSLSNGSQKRLTTIADLASSNYITNVSILFRRGLFGGLPDWFSEVSTYDYAIHLMNAQYGDIYYSPKVMAVYRIHEKGIWSDSGAEKRLLIAMKIRELLMDYFRDNKVIYTRLQNAWFAIAKSLYALYTDKNKVSELDKIKSKVISTYPEKLELLSLPVVKKHTSVSSGLKKGATYCRKLISKAIPLPRI